MPYFPAAMRSNLDPRITLVIGTPHIPTAVRSRLSHLPHLSTNPVSTVFLLQNAALSVGNILKTLEVFITCTAQSHHQVFHEAASLPELSPNSVRADGEGKCGTASHFPACEITSPTEQYHDHTFVFPDFGPARPYIAILRHSYLDCSSQAQIVRDGEIVVLRPATKSELEHGAIGNMIVWVGKDRLFMANEVDTAGSLQNWRLRRPDASPYHRSDSSGDESKEVPNMVWYSEKTAESPVQYIGFPPPVLKEDNGRTGSQPGGFDSTPAFQTTSTTSVHPWDDRHSTTEPSLSEQYPIISGSDLVTQHSMPPAKSYVPYRPAQATALDNVGQLYAFSSKTWPTYALPPLPTFLPDNKQEHHHRHPEQPMSDGRTGPFDQPGLEPSPVIYEGRDGTETRQLPSRLPPGLEETIRRRFGLTQALSTETGGHGPEGTVATMADATVNNGNDASTSAAPPLAVSHRRIHSRYSFPPPGPDPKSLPVPSFLKTKLAGQSSSAVLSSPSTDRAAAKTDPETKGLGSVELSANRTDPFHRAFPVGPTGMLLTGSADSSHFHANQFFPTIRTQCGAKESRFMGFFKNNMDGGRNLQPGDGAADLFDPCSAFSSDDESEADDTDEDEEHGEHDDALKNTASTPSSPVQGAAKPRRPSTPKDQILGFNCQFSFAKTGGSGLGPSGSPRQNASCRPDVSPFTSAVQKASQGLERGLTRNCNGGSPSSPAPVSSPPSLSLDVFRNDLFGGYYDDDRTTPLLERDEDDDGLCSLPFDENINSPRREDKNNNTGNSHHAWTGETYGQYFPQILESPNRVFNAGPGVGAVEESDELKQMYPEQKMPGRASQGGSTFSDASYDLMLDDLGL